MTEEENECTEEGLHVNAWELLYSCFRDGDDVVFIDDQDNIFGGKLKYLKGAEKKLYFNLISISGTTKEYVWSEIRFMSHYGFPVKKLSGADGSRFIEQTDTTDIQKALREIIGSAMCFQCSKKISVDGNFFKGRAGEGYLCKDHHHLKRAVFGDPFLIEDVRAVLYNRGNCGPEWYGHPCEESTLLVSRDGAKGILYEVPTVYHFEY
jgi:hypothetical protein